MPPAREIKPIVKRAVMRFRSDRIEGRRAATRKMSDRKVKKDKYADPFAIDSSLPAEEQERLLSFGRCLRKNEIMTQPHSPNARR